MRSAGWSPPSDRVILTAPGQPRSVVDRRRPRPRPEAAALAPCARPPAGPGPRPCSRRLPLSRHVSTSRGRYGADPRDGGMDRDSAGTGATERSGGEPLRKPAGDADTPIPRDTGYGNGPPGTARLTPAGPPAPKPSRPRSGHPLGPENRRPAPRHEPGKTVKRTEALTEHARLEQRRDRTSSSDLLGEGSSAHSAQRQLSAASGSSHPGGYGGGLRAMRVPQNARWYCFGHDARGSASRARSAQ